MRPSPYKKSPSASIQESTVRMSMSGCAAHSFVDMDFAQDEYELPRAECFPVVVDPAQYATYYLANHRPLFSASAQVVATALASAASLSLLSDAHSSSESLPSTAARALHGHRDADDVEDTPKLSSSSATRAPSWIRQIDDALALDSPVGSTAMSEVFFRLPESPTATLSNAETDVGHPTAPTHDSEKKSRRASSVEYSYATRQAQVQVQVGPPRMRKDSLPRKLATKLGRGLKDFFNAPPPPPVPPVPQAIPVAVKHVQLAPPPMRRAISSQP